VLFATCRAIVRLPKPKIKKLEQKGIECIFLGYAQHIKGNRIKVVEPNNYVEVNTVIESINTEFYQNKLTLIPLINDKIVEPIRNNNESGEPIEPFETGGVKE
jgi:hypothetical protein